MPPSESGIQLEKVDSDSTTGNNAESGSASPREAGTGAFDGSILFANAVSQSLPFDILRVASEDSDTQVAGGEDSTQKRIVKPKAKVSWTQRIFGIGPTKRGVVGSRIIHPMSPFSQSVSLLSTVLLGYVAIVTPVTIGFFWQTEGCFELPTLKMDMAVDCFFLLEIVYTFFVGISYQGRYRDDLPFVAKTYLRTAFPFDLLTSIPVAIIEYITLQDCFAGVERSSLTFAMPQPTVEPSQLRIVRASKPLRIFKMARILKTSRLVYVFDWLESELRPPPFLTRMLRIIFIIAMIVHLCTCAFWLVKDAYRDPEEVREFLYEQGLSATPNLADKYLVGMYFINTVFTTVGFGDITASNGAERVYFVAVMYVGTLVFGAMLGEVQMVMAQMRKAEREKAEVVQEAKDYLRYVEAAPHLERKLLRWLNFDFDSKRRQHVRDTMQTKFAPKLLRELTEQAHRERLQRLPVFSEMQHAERDAFLLELFMKMHSVTTCARHPLALANTPADRLFLVQHGSIKVTLGDGGMQSPPIATLIPGDFLGEYSLFEEATWQTSQGKPASFWCETHVECLVLLRQDFLAILSQFPEELEDELFFLAEQEHEIRKKTMLIDNIQILRWCQLVYKLVNRSKAADQASKVARDRRTTFKLALHRQRRMRENKQRKTSLMLASTSNLSPSGSSPLAVDAGQLPSCGSFENQFPATASNGIDARLLSPKSNGSEGMRVLMPVDKLGRGCDDAEVRGTGNKTLESLIRSMHEESRAHREMVTNTLNDLDARMTQRMASLESQLKAVQSIHANAHDARRTGAGPRSFNLGHRSPGGPDEIQTWTVEDEDDCSPMAASTHSSPRGSPEADRVRAGSLTVPSTFKRRSVTSLELRPEAAGARVESAIFEFVDFPAGSGDHGSLARPADLRAGEQREA